LTFSGCTGLEKLQYRCERVEHAEHPPLRDTGKLVKPSHASLHKVVSHAYSERAAADANKMLELRKHELGLQSAPVVYRCIGAIKPDQL
jgi:hypothetical protein